jgi:hypothetical protein
MSEVELLARNRLDSLQLSLSRKLACHAVTVRQCRLTHKKYLQVSTFPPNCTSMVVHDIPEPLIRSDGVECSSHSSGTNIPLGQIRHF